MRTVGVDLAAEAAGTAVATLDSTAGHARPLYRRTCGYRIRESVAEAMTA